MLNSRRSFAVASLLLFLFGAAARQTWACPFCTALRPTLAQQRESASVVVLGEASNAEEGKTVFRIHQTLFGKSLLGERSQLTLSPSDSFQIGSLALLMASEGSKTNDASKKESETASFENLAWKAILVNEGSIAYFVRSPSLREAPAKRLAYFAKYLEHADALIAEDAYQEFGHAAYADVLKVASHFDNAKLRHWITDERVSQDRKGFYAIALSMTDDQTQRTENAKLLRRLIDQPTDGFRAGFDGILGSYLITKGEAGLELIESKYLANPRSGDGDVRSAMGALRFYFEFGDKISVTRLRTAMRHLLSRPEFAHTAIVDLARWEDWKTLDRIVGLYDKASYPQPATRRAVVGYLSACPLTSADKALETLRGRDAKGVAEAERHLLFFGASRQ